MRLPQIILGAILIQGCLFQVILPANAVESSDVSQTPSEQTVDQEIRRRELEIAIVKQTQALMEAEKKLLAIESEAEKVQEALDQAEAQLAKLHTGNPEARSLFYKDLQEKPLTAEGIFYDQVMMEKKRAQKEVDRLEKAMEKTSVSFENEKRLLEEKKQRLRDYDQAVSERWNQNPF